MLVKVKKLKSFYVYFVILLTFIIIISCNSKNYFNYKAESTRININTSINSDEKINEFIAPFKNNIEKDLDSVLAYNPENLDKSKGKWETNIGQFLANVTFELGNPLFQKRENKSIDFCLLNHGGIRSNLPKGNITSRSAYNIMPFENSLFIVGLTGVEVKDLVQYFIDEKKPHPLYGLKIFTNKNLEIVKIKINDELLENEKLYYVATSDYLANGGDNMTFLRNSKIKFDLDYKLRNLLIDYFKSVDTLKIYNEQFIIEN